MTIDSKVNHNSIRKVFNEMQEQPAWRTQADREMDYYDGNQLDNATLKALEAKGVPPSIENLIAPAIRDILGMEAKNRTDWRVMPDGDRDIEADEVADALGFKLNQSERASNADQACSYGYSSQVKMGLGWVEVSRNSDPFKFPYRCKGVHRNEIWWDFLSKEDDLSDARWLLRRRWTDIDVAVQMFPGKADLIRQAGQGWNNMDELNLLLNDSGGMTELAQAQEIERGWSVEELEWRTPETGRVCLFELLTRAWEQAFVLKLPGGRIVEFDDQNPVHTVAVYYGTAITKATISRVYKHFFLGPHILHSEESEFQRFNYVPFWGEREDRTNIPYGVIRGLMYMQDEVNARISKMQWLLAAVRTERTKGAVDMPDTLFRQEIGRPDADILLNIDHMKIPGARFAVEANEQLNAQQYNRLVDLRDAIRNNSGVSEAFSGDGGNDTASGLSAMIEQTVQSLAAINDNFANSRMQVGDLLLSMLVADMGSTPEKVMIAGEALKDDREILLNQPAVDEQTQEEFLTNDVSRTKLKVVLEDVPSTPSFRQQQLSALSEAFKSAPEKFQEIMMPHLMHLANVPNKEDIIKAIMELNSGDMMTVEQADAKIEEAIEEAKVKWMVEQKTRELDIKEKKTDSEIEKIIAETVNKAIESIYSATQAGMQIMSVPGVAQSADQVLNSAGFEDKDAVPIVAPPGHVSLPMPDQNTSPMFPPRVQEPDVLPPEEPMVDDLETAGEGVQRGIEAPGVQ